MSYIAKRYNGSYWCGHGKNFKWTHDRSKAKEFNKISSLFSSMSFYNQMGPALWEDNPENFPIRLIQYIKTGPIEKVVYFIGDMMQ